MVFIRERGKLATTKSSFAIIASRNIQIDSWLREKKCSHSTLIQHADSKFRLNYNRKQ